MKTYGIRDLRNHTAEVLAEAERRGEVRITNRGRVVARLLPVRDATPIEDFTAWIESLEAHDTGWGDEFLSEKHRESEAAEAKPWE